MVDYKGFIGAIKPFEYEKYESVSSFEKLVIYSAYYLECNNIPLYYNYIYITAFKLFPQRFCCDQDFPEYPSPDTFTRTMMHLKYQKNGNSYLNGSPQTGYSITKLGLITAKEVEQIIRNGKSTTLKKAEIKTDAHKKAVSQEYNLILKSPAFVKYKETKEIDYGFVWELYKVIPFTQINKIKDSLNQAYNYAKETNDLCCIEFLKTVIQYYS